MKFQKVKSGLLLGVAAIGAFYSAPVLAQNADGADDKAGDIIVTARRVEERLQDVPISITVFNQAQLTQRNIAVATDLAAYTPSLTVNQRFGPEKSVFNIRGYNQDLGTAPTVGVYFAEVVGIRAQGGTASGNTVGAGSFTDLQNVQVLKGVQGTLFGRNTTGGAVLLTPKKPTDRLEGYIEGTYGNFDQLRVAGALNIPVSEGLRIRLTGERNKRDGFMVNRSGIGPRDYNDVNYSYGRVSIVADLAPNLENYTIATYSNSFGHGYATRITGCADPSSPVGPLNTTIGTAGYSGTRHLQAASCAIQLARQNARGDSLYDVETSSTVGSVRLKQWQVINTTTWQASDTLTIKNIMSYGQFRENSSFDLGSSNFVVPNTDTNIFGSGFALNRIDPRLTTTGGAPGGIALIAAAGAPYQRIILDSAGPDTNTAAESSFTEELQLQGKSADGKLTYVIGGYLEFARPIGNNQQRTGSFNNCVRPRDLNCTNTLRIGSVSESNTRLAFDNHGIFAQATYNFTDKLALTGGIRYTFDKIVGIGQSTTISIVAPGTARAFNDPVSGVLITRTCSDSVRHSVALGGLPGLDTSSCMTQLENKSSAPTWLIGLDFKPSDDLLIYGKYSRGYRQGGMNFTTVGLETWRPEKTDSFEVGAKASFNGAVSGNVNIAAFYNKLSDQQVFAAFQPSNASAAAGVRGSGGVINVGSSRIIGFEADASLQFGEGFRIDASYAHIATKVNSVDAPAVVGDGSRLGTLMIGTPYGSVAPNVQAGSAFVNSPKDKLTVTGSYTLPLDESLGRLSAAVTWVAQSGYVNDGSVPQFVNGIGLGFTPATNLVNANIDWRGVGGSPIDLSFFVTNLTKETFNVANSGAWTGSGVAEVLLNQPRFFGVRVKYSFGD